MITVENFAGLAGSFSVKGSGSCIFAETGRASHCFGFSDIECDAILTASIFALSALVSRQVNAGVEDFYCPLTNAKQEKTTAFAPTLQIEATGMAEQVKIMVHIGSPWAAIGRKDLAAV